MNFIKQNKLLASLVLALSMVIIVVLIFTTAKMTPAMSKLSDKPYYDIPKGKSPAPLMTPESALKARTKIGFIDPIVKKKMQEQRDGIPSPLDIMNSSELLAGVQDKAFPKITTPTIPGYGKAPKSPYELLYDPNTPFKFTGRPGLLGQSMAEIFDPNKELLPPDEETDEPPVPSEFKGFGDSNMKGSVDMQKFKTAMFNLFSAVLQAQKNNAITPPKPAEGQLEEAVSDELKKTKVDSGSSPE
ncbi:hypothetical protein KKB99_05740 [bacterium]|nr:hypothetical protein [bacterium]MBU1025493.1 hypothetical protein [bacterium]